VIAYLQTIAEGLSKDNLPEVWQGSNLSKFSSDKILYNFQVNALNNALKALWIYYKDKNAQKNDFFKLYESNGFSENLDYDLTYERKSASHLLEYENDYKVETGKISFKYFLNRMSFWMATGSGKTLIIVKLISLIGELIRNNEIPKNDVLFLAHRDDLLEQFRNHIDEFNSFNFEYKINLVSLRDYDKTKYVTYLPFGNKEITVYYYRSDLISDEQKEKLVNYKNYDNEGKWFILLDEAHKGDKEDSKRQVLYSILSRNGFLFNFSATFTDPRDYVTCVYNFNLAKYIEQGYGKHIYLSASEVTAFRNKDDFSKTAKQKIVLKSMVLMTYINKNYEKVKKEQMYHRPILMTLVNSVDTKDADLKMFFNELEKVATGELKAELLNEVKDEILNEIKVNPQYIFENFNFIIDESLISNISYEDVLKYVFNSKSPGKIEVLKIPGNKNEIVFKLQTTEKPFGLIKIGDISGWLKDKLSGYEIIESFENESVFKKLNADDSEINILMGSRAFYEGWDSDRPNIILFINIGIGTDAKKFVLQSIGRGVRIAPFSNKKRRLQNLLNDKQIENEIYEKYKKYIMAMESLIVFGTNPSSLNEIIKTLKEESGDRSLGNEFLQASETTGNVFLIPTYKNTNTIFAEDSDLQKYPINKNDFVLATEYYQYIGDKVTLVKYESDIKVLAKVKDSFMCADKFYDFNEKRTIQEPDILLTRLFDYYAIQDRGFDRFKQLENEIVHFKRITVSDPDKYDEILQAVIKVAKFPQKQEIERKIDREFEKTRNTKKYKEQVKQLEIDFVSEAKVDKLWIKYIQNHYYLPVITSTDEKIQYINHIITVDSEVKFVEALEAYLKTDTNIFKEFDWWMFSKLDQTLDEIYIPYYNPKENMISKFKPDFIFWLKKGKQYKILFVDPKGTEHSDGYRKIDGYRRIFENKIKNELNKYSVDDLSVQVQLLLKPKQGIAGVLEKYRQYWFDNFSDFANKLK
jgi:superfamily II DNA or RNA helicase